MAASLAQLDLNLLVVLDALLAEQSVTRASKILGLSQPATSAALARLRRFFDDPLFVRTGRRLEPTAFALRMREPVQDIVRRIEVTIDRRSKFDPRSSNREFTLAGSDYAVLVLAPALHAALSKDAPNVRLRFVPLELAARKATASSADLVVVPQTHARGRHENLFRDRWVFVADKNNPEIGKRLTISALRRLPFVRHRYSTSHGSLIAAALEGVNFERPAAVTVSDFSTALLLIPGTRLVTLCQERLIRIARTTVHVRMLKPPFAIAPLLEVMAWNPVHESDPAHTWLRGLVRRVAAAL